jgi:hypothetical protein
MPQRFRGTLIPSFGPSSFVWTRHSEGVREVSRHLPNPALNHHVEAFMAKSWGGKKVEQRLAATRNEHWPGARAWLSEPEVGFFLAPRTLPLVLGLLNSKKLSGVQDLSATYLELFASHTGQGVIHISSYEEHAFRAGYYSNRAERTWTERMAVLEELGFIKSVPSAKRRFGIVLLTHPTLAIAALREQGRVEDDWWNYYREVQRSTGEPSFEDLRRAMDEQAQKKTQKAVPVAATSGTG